MKKWMALIAVTVVALMLVAVGPAAAARPEDPTAKAELGSFNKSDTGLEHQSKWAWYYDGPAEPHVEWD